MVTDRPQRRYVLLCENRYAVNPSSLPSFMKAVSVGYYTIELVTVT